MKRLKYWIGLALVLLGMVAMSFRQSWIATLIGLALLVAGALLTYRANRKMFETLDSEATYTDYIDVLYANGICSVAVIDAELFDFLDDLFVDNNIEPQWITHDSPGHRFVFGSGVSRESVMRVLSSVPREEVERIYRINNPPDLARDNVAGV
jgi:fermentation-respiration switch protein FrsA (DUF1100 family)